MITEGRKLSGQMNNLYSAEINKWIRTHYRPGDRSPYEAVELL